MPRPRILVIGRKNATEAEIALRARAGSFYTGRGAEVVQDTALNWKRLRAEYGGYRGAYAYAGTAYDAVVVLERYDEALGHVIGRGQYEICGYARDAGIPVVAFRVNERLPVTGLEIVDPNDWANSYGRLVVDALAEMVTKAEEG